MKKSILFVSHVSSKSFGGAERVLDDILVGLDRDKFNAVLLLQKNADKSDRLNWDCKVNTTIEYFDFGSLSHRYRLLTLISVIYRMIKGFIYIPYLIKKHNIDIVYANSLIAGAFTVIPSRLLNKCFFYHEHNIADQRKGHFIGMALGPVAKLSTGIICISKSVKESLSRLGVPSFKLHLVYNGFDFERLDKVESNDFPVRQHNKTIRIGMVANFIPWKRHMLFLELMDKLSINIPSVSIDAIIVGGELPGNERYFRDVVDWLDKYHGNVNYILTGFQDNVADYLRSFDILINPAKAEPFGLIFIEAMYLKCVVIGSTEGAAPEILDQDVTGIVVDYDNEDSVLKRLHDISLDVTLRKKIGEQAALLVQDKFSLNRQLIKIEHLLSDCE